MTGVQTCALPISLAVGKNTHTPRHTLAHWYTHTHTHLGTHLLTGTHTHLGTHSLTGTHTHLGTHSRTHYKHGTPSETASISTACARTYCPTLFMALALSARWETSTEAKTRLDVAPRAPSSPSCPAMRQGDEGRPSDVIRDGGGDGYPLRDRKSVV